MRLGNDVNHRTTGDKRPFNEFSGSRTTREQHPRTPCCRHPNALTRRSDDDQWFGNNVNDIESVGRHRINNHSKIEIAATDLIEKFSRWRNNQT